MRHGETQLTRYGDWKERQSPTREPTAGPEVVSSGSPVGSDLLNHLVTGSTLYSYGYSDGVAFALPLRCGEENNKGFFQRSDTLSHHACLPDYRDFIADDGGIVPTAVILGSPSFIAQRVARYVLDVASTSTSSWFQSREKLARSRSYVPFDNVAKVNGEIHREYAVLLILIIIRLFYDSGYRNIDQREPL